MTPTSDSKSNSISRYCANAGFTLLELLLVLSIIGLASILVVPNVGNLESRAFSIQIRQAHSLLNHARRDAVVRGQPSSINFILTEEFEDCTSIDSPTVVGSWESNGISLSFEDSSNIEREIDNCIEVSFYPEGGSTGGTLHFNQENQQARLVIDPFSGRVSQPELDGS